MEYIKEWLRSILYMNVLLFVFESLLQKTKYETYFRLFSGFLMMMCLMKPLVDLAGIGQYLNASYVRNQLESEWKVIERSGDLKKIGNEMREEFDDAISAQVKNLASSFFIEVTDVRIWWNAKGDGIARMKIEGEEMEGQEMAADSSSFCELLMDYYDLSAEEIEIEVEE